MSGDSKKPTITRAGKKPETTPIVKKEKSRSEKKREAKAQKKLEKQEKRRQEADLIRQKKRDKKAAKQRKVALRKQKSSSSSPQSLQGQSLKTTEGKPEVTKGQTLAVESKKSSKQVKKDKKKRKKAQKADKTYLSRKLSSKSRLAMSGIAVVVLLLVGYGIANDKPAGFVSSDSTTSDLLGDSDASTNSTPGFVTVKPRTDAGKLRSLFDSDKGFYSFQEEYDGKMITVSQAEVPGDYEFDLDVLLQTTEYTSAARIESSKGVVYILVSDSSTLQQALFKYSNSLVSIYSLDGLSNLQWTDYIDSL